MKSLNRRIARLLHAIRPVAVPAYPMVASYSWRPQDDALNFGDHLADVIVDLVLAGRGHSRFEEVARAARLFTVGSVLHFAHDGDTVWGSGINGKIPEEAHRFGRLDVRAVRGPLTAERLRARGIAVPDVYGDPALLLPHLLPGRFTVTGVGEPVFVLNLNDLAHSNAATRVISTVSPLRGWNVVIGRILASRLVLSSSLHGLIIAEAYGIPARYVRLSEHESLFKYEDYLRGSGRSGLEFATSIEEGLEMGGMAPISWQPDRLLASFPFDLWAQPEI